MTSCEPCVSSSSTCISSPTRHLLSSSRRRTTLPSPARCRRGTTSNGAPTLHTSSLCLSVFNQSTRTCLATRFDQCCPLLVIDVDSKSHSARCFRSALQLYVQKPAYHFFKYNFDRWPLDASFRIVSSLPPDRPRRSRAYRVYNLRHSQRT